MPQTQRPTTFSSNNALPWFTGGPPIHSQVEHAGTVELSQPSSFTTTFKFARYYPLAPYPPRAHINVSALPPRVLNHVPPHFSLIPTAFPFGLLPPQAVPLHPNNPVANNVNQLPLSPPAQLISSANVSAPQLNHPPPPQKRYQPQNLVPITHAPLAPPNPDVGCFPASVPSNAEPFVCTSANLNTVQPAPLSNPDVPTSLRSSFPVQAATRSQNHVTSEFMQSNPASSSTGTTPTFVTPIIPPRYGATVPKPVVLGWPTASHTCGSFYGLRGFDKAVGGRNHL